MKKVVLLCGSPRLKGNTAQVVEECAKVIREPGEVWDDEEGIRTVRHFAGNVARLITRPS